jgi:hypothetical protein
VDRARYGGVGGPGLTTGERTGGGPGVRTGEGEVDQRGPAGHGPTSATRGHGPYNFLEPWQTDDEANWDALNGL